MNTQEIENKVIELIVDKLCVGSEEVKPEARLMDDLGADSLDVVELLMEFEKDFNTIVPDEDAYKIHTVKDIIDYAEQHL
ncbi:MAG: acyl carrier protein [Prevotella sp.]|nr:acyl carrier protein [Prevotella sp.]